MLVSNNSLLNILLPNENSTLKNALKEADAKTYENLKSSNTTVADILKNLFNDATTGAKSNTAIENLLKNSVIFKDLQNFTKSISNLLDTIKDDEAFAKYKPLLQNFLKDLSTMDANSLKDLMGKSGIFLESKALDQVTAQTNFPKNLENILNNIKEILKDIPSLEARKIETLIDKIITANPKGAQSNPSIQTQNSIDLKSLVSMLQNLSKGLSNNQLENLSSLTNMLKSISNDAQLIESKISNTAQVQQQQVQQAQAQQLQENLPQAKENAISKTLDTLLQLRSELSTNKNIPNAQAIIKQIDSLLQSNDLFSKNNSVIDVKNLVSQLTNFEEVKNIANQNSTISTLVTNLKEQANTIDSLESKLMQNQNITPQKQQLTDDIKQTLLSLRNEFSNMNIPDNKLINQIIDKLLNIENIFSKIELPMDLRTIQQNLQTQNTNPLVFQSNFSSNINELILTLKENIVNLSTDQNSLQLQNTVLKTVEKLEHIIDNFLKNATHLSDKQQTTNSLQNDLKSVLLQMQSDLGNKNDVNSQEILKQVDRMVTGIEYQQLLSVVSNSNTVYIPFVWDMMDEGTISMKKVDENKFYCEINLSLKEFGQTQLLLALYDKNKIDLTIYASKTSFKQAIRENSSKLKQALNSVKLIPVNIKIIDLKNDKEKTPEKTPANVYTQQTGNDFGFGIDIKA